MPQTGPPPEIWAEGDAYEPFIGRWSRLVAAEFVDWLDVPPERRWLDVGCGTGALTATVLERARPASVVGLDTSAGFVAYAQQRLDDPRASFQVGDALDLPFTPGAFDAVVSGLVLNHIPDPERMVREMARVTAGGGTVAAYVWDYDAEMQQLRLFWEVATRLDPGAAAFDQRRRYPICQPQPLHDLFASVGLRDVAVTGITVPTVYRDFDAYWLPFLGGQGSAPGFVQTLNEGQLVVLRDEMRSQLSTEPDGSIRLQARAWTVRGTD